MPNSSFNINDFQILVVLKGEIKAKYFLSNWFELKLIGDMAVRLVKKERIEFFMYLLKSQVELKYSRDQKCNY